MQSQQVNGAPVGIIREAQRLSDAEFGGGSGGQEYVTRIAVTRQRYIAISKVALLDSFLLADEQQSSFRTICSCLEAILHAEHKVSLEELRLDKLMSGDECRHAVNYGRSSSKSRFQRNIMRLLRSAKFQELSARDLQLTAALNSDYLLTLPISVDWTSSTVVVFRRGYATEKQEGYLFGAKLDYLQSLLLRKFFGIVVVPLVQAGKAVMKKSDSVSAWAEAFKEWLEEPLPSDNELPDDISTKQIDDLPIWIAARRAVPRYEAVLSGSRGKLFRSFLVWMGILPAESLRGAELLRGPPPAAEEERCSSSYLARVSMRDIWLQLKSHQAGWEKLRSAFSIFFTRSTLQEPAYKELVVMHQRGGEDDSQLELNTYKNIPIPDLKVVFPNKRLAFRLLDTVRLDLATILGLAAFVVNYKFDDLLSSPSAFVLDVVATAALLVFITRAALGYKQTWDRYQLLVNKTLYEKTLASDFGVVHFLIDASEEQQLKEAALLYGVLLQTSSTTGPQDNKGMRLEELASRCEVYVYNSFGLQIEMAVQDATELLLRLGVVRLEGTGIVRLVPHSEAVRSLESRWQALLRLTRSEKSLIPWPIF